MRVIWLAEIQVFANKAGHHTVGQSGQPSQSSWRRVPFTRWQNLCELVKGDGVRKVAGRCGSFGDQIEVGAGCCGRLRAVNALLGDVAPGRRCCKARQRDGLAGLPADFVRCRARFGLFAKVRHPGVNINAGDNVARACTRYSSRQCARRVRDCQRIDRAGDAHLRGAVARVIKPILSHWTRCCVNDLVPRQPVCAVLVYRLDVRDAFKGVLKSHFANRCQAAVVEAHVFRPLRRGLGKKSRDHPRDFARKLN